MTPQSKVEQVFVNVAERIKSQSQPVFVGSPIHGALMIYNNEGTTLTCPVGMDGSMGNMSLSTKLNDDVEAILDSLGSITLKAENKYLTVDRIKDMEVFDTVLEAFDTSHTKDLTHENLHD